MKNVKKVITHDAEFGNSLAVLYTSIGTFKGFSVFNHREEKGQPSKWVGCSIAENRALIAYTKEKVRLKRAEIKGLKRFIKSYYTDPKTQAKAKKLLKAMNEELEELLYEIEDYNNNIKAAIKSQETYSRLKNIDRGARDAQMKFIQEGIAALKTAPSYEDKID